jgi:hypothetical protein
MLYAWAEAPRKHKLGLGAILPYLSVSAACFCAFSDICLPHDLVTCPCSLSAAFILDQVNPFLHRRLHCKLPLCLQSPAPESSPAQHRSIQQSSLSTLQLFPSKLAHTVDSFVSSGQCGGKLYGHRITPVRFTARLLVFGTGPSWVSSVMGAHESGYVFITKLDCKG